MRLDGLSVYFLHLGFRGSLVLVTRYRRSLGPRSLYMSDERKETSPFQALCCSSPLLLPSCALRTCLLGGFWMCLGLALCAVCTHESSLLLISYGVITALGCGLCYSVPLAAALKLSPPQDKGWVSYPY